MAIQTTKQCPKCGALNPYEAFASPNGGADATAHNCGSCGAPSAEYENTLRLAAEGEKIRKLKIIFGQWWPHYTPPSELALTVYRERDFCPYCGGPLGPFAVPSTDSGGLSPRNCAHLDHMDPLSLGGADTVRNVAYACANCNLKKRGQGFAGWLLTLQPDFQILARRIYVEKHGHSPEAFVPVKRQLRVSKPILELALSEDVLRVLYPRPIVSGPPEWLRKPA